MRRILSFGKRDKRRKSREPIGDDAPAPSDSAQQAKPSGHRRAASDGASTDALRMGGLPTWAWGDAKPPARLERDSDSTRSWSSLNPDLAAQEVKRALQHASAYPDLPIRPKSPSPKFGGGEGPILRILGQQPPATAEAALSRSSSAGTALSAAGTDMASASPNFVEILEAQALELARQERIIAGDRYARDAPVASEAATDGNLVVESLFDGGGDAAGSTVGADPAQARKYMHTREGHSPKATGGHTLSTSERHSPNAREGRAPKGAEGGSPDSRGGRSPPKATDEVRSPRALGALLGELGASRAAVDTDSPPAPSSSSSTAHHTCSDASASSMPHAHSQQSTKVRGAALYYSPVSGPVSSGAAPKQGGGFASFADEVAALASAMPLSSKYKDGSPPQLAIQVDEAPVPARGIGAVATAAAALAAEHVFEGSLLHQAPSPAAANTNAHDAEPRAPPVPPMSIYGIRSDPASSSVDGGGGDGGGGAIYHTPFKLPNSLHEGELRSMSAAGAVEPWSSPRSPRSCLQREQSGSWPPSPACGRANSQLASDMAALEAEAVAARVEIADQESVIEELRGELRRTRLALNHEQRKQQRNPRAIRRHYGVL